MAGRTVVGSDGATWTVRRRWLPWRGPVSFREMWHSPSEKTSAAEDATAAEEPPPGAALRFLQLTVVIVAWMLLSPHLETRWSGHLAMHVMLLNLILVTR